jgi:hypothetical protein
MVAVPVAAVAATISVVNIAGPKGTKVIVSKPGQLLTAPADPNNFRAFHYYNVPTACTKLYTAPAGSSLILTQVTMDAYTTTSNATGLSDRRRLPQSLDRLESRDDWRHGLSLWPWRCYPGRQELVWIRGRVSRGLRLRVPRARCNRTQLDPVNRFSSGESAHTLAELAASRLGCLWGGRCASPGIAAPQRERHRVGKSRLLIISQTVAGSVLTTSSTSRMAI